MENITSPLSRTSETRSPIRLTPEQAQAKRQTIQEQQAEKWANDLWLSRGGDTVVSSACKKAFAEAGNKTDKETAIKQHMVSYAALKWDRLVDHNCKMATPENKKSVFNKISSWLDVPSSSAGKSSLESAARVKVDKHHLDDTSAVPKELRKLVREKLGQRIFESLTHEMNMTLNKHIENKGISGSNGQLITSQDIDHRLYDELLILQQGKSRENIAVVGSGR